MDEGVVPLKLRSTYRVSSIEKRLKNPFYAAIPKPHGGYRSQFEWRGTRYEGKHQPVFTALEWEQLQATFGQRPRYRKCKHRGLFSQGPLRLTCAECGCTITYAPKTKPSGVRYDYYRCANGKKVHRTQINVSEERILEQLGRAVDEIVVSDELALALMDALTEAHEDALRRKDQEAERYKAALGDVDDRDNRLYDRLDAGEIDSVTYKRQHQRLREERDRLFDNLRGAERSLDDGYLLTAQRVLELATRAKLLWNGRPDVEKRDLLADLVLEPRLRGQTVEYDLKKPFEALSRMRGNEGIE